MSNAKKATINSAKKSSDVPAVDVTFEYDGETYTVNADVIKDDIEILEAFEDNKVTTAIRAIVGPDQWRLFKAKKRGVDDLGEFTQLVMQSFGMEAGE